MSEGFDGVVLQPKIEVSNTDVTISEDVRAASGKANPSLRSDEAANHDGGPGEQH